jgi:chromosome segregation ATPase
LSTAIEKANEDKKKFQKRISQLETAIEESRHQITQLSSTLAASRQECTDLQKRLDSKTMETRQLEKRYEDFEITRKTYEEERAQLLAQTTQYKEQLTLAKQQLQYL